MRKILRIEANSKKSKDIGMIDNQAPTTLESLSPDFSEERVIDFVFRGKAREYFGIWVVNVLLSIITFGIYSAWAKVRRLRYFYGNTWLDGHNFEYHAKPKQILIGRLVVTGLLIGYNILLHISPAFSVLALAVMFLFPWIVNKSIAFHARMTSYRNVRFGFEGSYWRAFRVFLL